MDILVLEHLKANGISNPAPLSLQLVDIIHLALYRGDITSASDIPAVASEDEVLAALSDMGNQGWQAVPHKLRNLQAFWDELQNALTLNAVDDLEGGFRSATPRLDELSWNGNEATGLYNQISASMDDPARALALCRDLQEHGGDPAVANQFRAQIYARQKKWKRSTQCFNLAATRGGWNDIFMCGVRLVESHPAPEEIAREALRRFDSGFAEDTISRTRSYNLPFLAENLAKVVSCLPALEQSTYSGLQLRLQELINKEGDFHRETTAFYSQVREALVRVGFLLPCWEAWSNIDIPIPECGSIGSFISQGQVRLGIYWMPDEEARFDEAYHNRSVVEKTFGEELKWNQNCRQAESTRPYSPEAAIWLVDAIPRLHRSIKSLFN